MLRGVPALWPFSHFVLVLGLFLLGGIEGRAQSPADRVPRTEEAWIVESVAATIAQFRASPPAPDAAVKAGDGVHVWDPSRYVTLAGTVLRGARAARATVDHDLRTPLAAATQGELLAQNRRISTLLASAPASASAHESAALLVAAFAWCDGDDVFGELRPALVRLTAHLAAAEAVRDGAAVTLDGALARIVLDTLMGHQQMALDGLGRIATRLVTPADRAWARAIRLRNTGNWREADEAMGGFLLERLELSRALRSRIDQQAMEAMLGRVIRKDEAIEWTRLVASGTSPSVGLARGLFEVAIEAEWEQAREVWRVLHPGAVLPLDFTKALNDSPTASGAGRAARPREVLDWPLWADFSQRQILRMVRANYRLLGQLGQPAEQAAFLTMAGDAYSRLVLSPVFVLSTAPSGDARRHARARGLQLVSQSPERLSATAWSWLFEDAPAAPADAGGLAHTWFANPAPRGTAFEFGKRFLRDGCDATHEQLQAWTEIRPFDAWALWCREWRRANGAPPFAAAKAAFGPLHEYDLWALRQLALRTYATPAERMAVMEQRCDISDFGCEDLAHYQVRQGQDAKAAASFERWLHATPDAVLAANSSAWLVRYYTRTGQLDRAESRARRAGEAFSNRGLQVLAHFLDSRGREDEAEAVYRTIHERYDTTTPLGTFLIRQGLRRNDLARQQQGWSLLQTTFPAGGERMFWHTLVGPPRDGLVFRTFGNRVAGQGLRSADIVVGVDEWRVRTAAQYRVVADLRHDATMTFTVWRDGGYQQVHAHLPGRWIGVEVEDYQPQ